VHDIDEIRQRAESRSSWKDPDEVLSFAVVSVVVVVVVVVV